MKQPLRIAHASDIHLDTDYYGGADNLASRDYYRGVFAGLLTEIAGHKPDLMLLPGDLFDSNRPSEDTVHWCMERLGEAPFPIALIPGNHDCLEQGGVLLRHDFSRVPNVEMLLSSEGELREFPQLNAAVWGKGMVEHSTEYRPLHGLPAAQRERWNLAMGHGIYVGRDAFSYRSSPIEARQIARSGYDYIALGHHHALLDVSAKSADSALGTAAYYCGAPVPISSDRKGTYLTVDLQPDAEAQVTIHELE